MGILDYTNIQDGQDQEQSAPDPIQALVTRNQQIQAELEKLKTVKTPQLSDPVAGPDDPESMSAEVLRGLFRQQIPTSDSPQFGEAFRQSISPAREVLANMFNGISASVMGTKFQSVRDKAYERFVTEKKLGMEQQQLQQTLKLQAAQIAQSVMKDRQDATLKREIENVRSTANDADRAEKLAALQQKYGNDNIQLLKFANEINQQEKKTALDTYKSRDTGDHLWDASRRRVEASLAAKGIDINTPEGYNAVLQATKAEWQNLVRFKEQVTGKKEGTNYTGLKEAVLANPALFHQLTPTIKTQIAPDLAKAGFAEFGKPLSEGAIKQLSDTKVALNALQKLRTTLEENKDLLGPVKGLARFNPFNEKAKIAQAKVNLVKQLVGKDIEGGVLHKEDEAKYKEILPILTDQPAVALGKLDELINNVGFRLNTFLDEQKNAGRSVNTPRATDTVPMIFPDGSIRNVPAADVSEAETKYRGKRK